MSRTLELIKGKLRINIKSNKVSQSKIQNQLI